MITIDRESNTPVAEQLVEQLRYLVASGHYQVSDTLPSTRKLGDQLGVSFHTVRKAYQALQEEGLLESKAGTGYLVKERTPLDKSERMERGAAVVHEALQRLIGFGLDDDEIEYLFEEQAALLDHADIMRKLIVAGPHPELNALFANQIGTALQRSVAPLPLDALRGHQDADFVFTPYPHLQPAMNAVPRADTIGFGTHFSAEVLERVARLLEHDTLGLITKHADTIPPLMKAVRAAAGFNGQAMAAAAEEGAEHLRPVIDGTDLIAYTPKGRRRLLPLLNGNGPATVRLTPLISPDALEAMRQAVPA